MGDFSDFICSCWSPIIAIFYHFYRFRCDFVDLKSSIFGHFHIENSEKIVFGLSEIRENAKKKKKKKEMVRNVILRILSTHMSKSAENWPRKIDFTIFSKRGGVADFDPPEESIWR